MRLWVVRFQPELLLLPGMFREAVVRAENEQQAMALFMQGQPHRHYHVSCLRRGRQRPLQVAELRSDGPAGVVSGTAVS